VGVGAGVRGLTGWIGGGGEWGGAGAGGGGSAGAGGRPTPGRGKAFQIPTPD
jgi:hypothetical protein